MSGTVAVAEKRFRVEIGMPVWTADAQPVKREAAWKNGRGRVDDIVIGQLGDAGDVGAGAADPPLCAPHGLGQPGRTRREHEQEQVVVGRWG